MTPGTCLRALLGPIVVVGALLLGTPTASASKEAIAYFGTEVGVGTLGGEFGNSSASTSSPGDMAVNVAGAGPASPGDIYVLDIANNRIQRFAQDDNGTPGDPYDDTYPFISAWGADVDATPSGGSDYEICTVAAECKEGVGAAGNGTVAGNGSLASRETQGPRGGIAVDEDTGDVYVIDQARRVNVYSGDGTFLRSFGWDVVQSGPGDNGTGYEVCVAVDGDVCKGGLSGSGVGQLTDTLAVAVSQPDGNAATGSVYVIDEALSRVNTYALGGSSPSSFGSSAQIARARSIAVDSRGIVYVDDATDIIRYDSTDANGSGVGFLPPISAPPLLASSNNGNVGLEVDPDSDGAGPDADVLYVLRSMGPPRVSVVQQFGPLNPPGLLTPPVASDDTHGSVAEFNFTLGLGLDSSRGRLFVSTYSNIGGPSVPFGPGNNAGVYVLDKAGGAPSANIDSIVPHPTSATVHATVDPNGGPPVYYHLEYSTDGLSWASTPKVLVGAQEAPQSIEALLQPPGTGLPPETLHHVRLVATKVFTPPFVTAEQTFTTLPAPPVAETVGSPVRTATSARLDGRVNPLGSPTTYHFEYGTQGPCDANPCTATAPLDADSGSLIELVSQQVAGLQPETTYHYRIVASSASGTTTGTDRTATTRSSNPLSHGHFPGPAGSDRAWEQVSLPDSGGNPVLGGTSFSNDGNRAVYQIGGGTPISDSGSAFSLYFSERTASGWQTRGILPRRDEVAGPNWLSPAGSADLLNLTAMNANVVDNKFSYWRLRPNGTPVKLADVAARGELNTSEDGSRVVLNSGGVQDISSGTPQLLSLLPNGEPACNAGIGGERRTEHWLSADGSLLVFLGQDISCSGPRNIYLRDLDAETTTPVSPAPLSGLRCETLFLKQTPGAVFFWTVSRLAAQDTVPTTCSRDQDGDVYRYDMESGMHRCVTCSVPGLPVDVAMNSGLLKGFGSSVAVSEDGSRVYFSSPKQLLPGTAAGGAYRVDVSSGDLAYVGPLGQGGVGDFVGASEAISPDGSVLIFRSSAAGLNQLNGAHNGGTAQYYRYDDRDRSLVCVSCPLDGSPPVLPASEKLAVPTFTQEISPNADPLDDEGNVFAFATPNALVGPDQNTPTSGDPTLGTDVYEWRDGRVLLVSDGLINWPQAGIVPEVNGVSANGRSIFFTASAQYTLDALDAYSRLYSARIGGGIDFPPPPKPCPLEVCQGTPKGAPDRTPPGSGFFQGPGNIGSTAPSRLRCPKGKVRRRSRCVLKPHKKKQRKGSHKRRAAR